MYIYIYIYIHIYIYIIRLGKEPADQLDLPGGARLD